MPKVVDQEQRREELLNAVTAVIVRKGIAGATTRAIAKESGWSTGALAHYFTDHDEILARALRYSHERIHSRWAEKLEGLRGRAALRVLILDNLPLDEERVAETRLEIVFWSHALHDERLLKIQQEEGANLRREVRLILSQCGEDGELSAGITLDEATERVLALIDGLSLHALHTPDCVPHERMLRIVEQEMDLLIGSAQPLAET